MLTEEQKIMKYAGNLACVYDYALCDTMERPIEQMSKEDCLSAIRKLYALLDGDIGRYPKDMTVRAKWAKNIWDFKQQTTRYTNDSIISVIDWDPVEVHKAYYKQKDAIEASVILNNLCKASGEPIGTIAYKVGIRKWTLVHWTCFQEEISPKFVAAIIALEDKGEPYTIYDLFDYVSATYGTKNKIVRPASQEDK
jgi:hypothetical protein